MSTGIELNELKELKIKVTPISFFECINFMKIICSRLGIEYSDLFVKDDKFNTALILSKVPDALGQLSILFADEYQEANKNKKDDEPREHGRIFKEYIRVLNLSTGINKERLEITSPKILTELFLKIILDPSNSFDESFFLGKLFRSINTIVGLI